MDPEENKQTEPTNELEPTTEPEGSEGNQTEPVGGDGAQEENLKDQHGQDAISKGKYQRDIAAKDAKIAELEALVSEASKTEEGRQELLGKIEEIKRESEVSKVEYELKLAGCRDDKATKAAMALLPDYENDVDKLKAECPYLFRANEKQGSTGGKPAGALEGLDEKLDKAFSKKY